VAAQNVTINNVLPGFFLTDRHNAALALAMEERGITREEAIAERAESVPAKRFGDPSEFGEACVFLCAAQAGYITGQNLLIDGGRFPGAF
jgi:3-oxoacyl-[acyl-carrier protein] reductase